MRQAMRYEFFKVQPNDVYRINTKDCFSAGEVGCAQDLIAIRGPASISMGFGEPGNQLRGICGSYSSWPGVAQLWAIFDKRVEEHPVSLRKACILLIKYAVAKQELRRVSITVKSDYTMGNRFAESLGFELEGKMRRFLPDGCDANLYVRLFL